MRCPQVGKGGAHDAGADLAAECPDDRFTAAVGHEPDVRGVTKITSRVGSGHLQFGGKLIRLWRRDLQIGDGRPVRRNRDGDGRGARN